MAGSDATNQRKRVSPAEGRRERFDLIVTFGLAAMITSASGVGSEYLKGRQRAGEQRCSIARQVVLDDVPNGALSGAQLTRLNAQALQRMERCLGEMS